MKNYEIVICFENGEAVRKNLFECNDSEVENAIAILASDGNWNTVAKIRKLRIGA